MHAPYPQITPEQRQAIVASGGLPVQVEDPETNKVYVLVEQSLTLDHDDIRDQLTKGVDAIEAGGRVEWNPERIKQVGRERLSARKLADS